MRAPLRSSVSTIEKFVNSRSAWVAKHLENYNNHTRLNGKIAEGEKVMFRGKEYTLRLIDGDRGSVRLSGDDLSVTAPVEKNPGFC